MVETANGRHRVRTAGSGFPLLVIPGGPGFGARYLIWALGDPLGRVSRLVFLDQRGTGASPVGTGELSVEAYAADMANVLDALGIYQTDLYAHSFGALQTVLFAAGFPDRVRRIVIEEGVPPIGKVWAEAFGPGTPIHTRRTEADIDEVEQIQTDPEWMHDQDKLLRYCDVAFRWMFIDPSLAARTPVDIDGAGYLQMEATQAAVRRAREPDFDFSSQVETITAGTLLVYGRASILGTAAAETYHALLPNSELVWLKGGHLPSMEDPERFAAVVPPFLQAPE